MPADGESGGECERRIHHAVCGRSGAVIEVEVRAPMSTAAFPVIGKLQIARLGGPAEHPEHPLRANYKVILTERIDDRFTQEVFINDFDRREGTWALIVAALTACKLSSVEIDVERPIG